jgi:hypothetical protein
MDWDVGAVGGIPLGELIGGMGRCWTWDRDVMDFEA